MNSQKSLFEADEDEKASAPVVKKDVQNMHTIADLIAKRANTPINKYVSREYQDYGYRLAMELGDEPHKALYIRMAKTIDRGILEQARTFVLDANALSRARLFMWKVKQVKEGGKKKQ